MDSTGNNGRIPNRIRIRHYAVHSYIRAGARLKRKSNTGARQNHRMHWSRRPGRFQVESQHRRPSDAERSRARVGDACAFIDGVSVIDKARRQSAQDLIQILLGDTQFIQRVERATGPGVCLTRCHRWVWARDAQRLRRIWLQERSHSRRRPNSVTRATGRRVRLPQIVTCEGQMSLVELANVAHGRDCA